MIHTLLTILRAVHEYCAECGWWVQNCPHQN